MLKSHQDSFQGRPSSISTASSSSIQNMFVYRPSKQEVMPHNPNTMINQFTQLKKNIQTQIKKNKNLYHQNLSLNKNFQYQLYKPQKKVISCSNQAICELLKQIDILLEQQNFLKKQKHIAQMKLQMVKQNQENECKGFLNQYLFLRSLWGSSKQRQNNSSLIRTDQYIQNLNKKVVLLKKNIIQISKTEKDQYCGSSQQAQKKQKNLSQFRLGRFQHKSSIQVVNQKINQIVNQTHPFQKMKEKYQQVLMENQQLRGRLHQSRSIKLIKSDNAKILQEKVALLQEENSIYMIQNKELAEKLKLSEMRQFQTLLKINEIQDKIYQKQRQLQKYLYQEMNTLKKYQIFDEEGQVFYQLKITKIKKSSQQQNQSRFQFKLQQIQNFLKDGMKNKKVSQTFNGEDQKKQQLRKSLSSGLLKKQQIDMQQEYAKQKFKTLKKDSSRASLSQMRKHISEISDKVSEDIKKNKFVRTSPMSPSYKKYQNQIKSNKNQIQNHKSQKQISSYQNYEQQEPQYECNKKQKQINEYKAPAFLFQKSNQIHLKKETRIKKESIHGQPFFSSKRNQN